MFVNSDTQRAEIHNAMNELKSRGYTDAHVIDAIEEWTAKRDAKELSKLSHKTYSRYRAYGIKNRDKAELLFNFFSAGPREFRVIYPEGLGIGSSINDRLFVEAVRDRFVSHRKANSYDDLTGLCGNYEMYRRSWQFRDSEEYFIRSLLKIELFDGLYKLTEVQKFQIGDDDPIHEVDEGFIFPYSTNFFALTNSPFCLKFYDVHFTYPEPAPRTSIRQMKGNLMAVAGKEAHPSFPFFARRAISSVDLAHLNKSDFSDREDMIEVFKYIFS